MHGLKKAVAGVLLALCSLVASAQDLVMVDSMNYPAWVVRNYKTFPLLPGTKLQSDDLVRTGTGGRLLLRLADGSALKLGESARFIVDSAEQTDTQQGAMLESAFQVLRGAFRFTSAFFKTTNLGYRVDVKIGAITAGIRGTDIWGRSNQAKDLVCLIEGLISVDTEGEPTTNMDQALSFFVKPKGQDALPVDQVDMQQLLAWAAETELDAELGIASSDGVWQLVLISLTSRQKAKQVMRGFHDKGFGVRIKSVIRQGRTLHRLLLPGFVSVEAALNARSQVREQLGVVDAWVWKAS